MCDTVTHSASASRAAPTWPAVDLRPGRRFEGGRLTDGTLKSLSDSRRADLLPKKLVWRKGEAAVEFGPK